MVVSSELDEIMDLSDRIAVMNRCRIMEIVEASQATKEYLGLLMAGITPTKAAKAAPKTDKTTKEAERVF